MKAEWSVIGFSLTYPVICTYAMFTDPRNISLDSLFAIGTLGVFFWPFLLCFSQAIARGMMMKGVRWPTFWISLAVSEVFGWWTLYWCGEIAASV